MYIANSYGNYIPNESNKENNNFLMYSNKLPEYNTCISGIHKIF